jgi:hypothetical protein
VCCRDIIIINLTAEVERLRAALEEIANWTDAGTSTAVKFIPMISINALAVAALTQKPSTLPRPAKTPRPALLGGQG